jgi:hypothetical protein
LWAAENWTDAAQGTRASIITTAVGGTTTSEKMRVWGNGAVSITTTFSTSPGASCLHVSGEIAVGTSVLSGYALNVLSNANLCRFWRNNGGFGGGFQFVSPSGKPTIYITNGGAETKLCKLGVTNQGVADGENLVLGLGSGVPSATDLGIIIAGTTGDVKINSTTASGGTSTGSLVTAGGVGIAGMLNVGTDAKVTGYIWATDYVRSDTYFIIGGPTVDGSWRMNKSGNDLVFERRESGSWVIKATIAA